MNPLSSMFERYRLIRNIPIFSKLNWFDVQRIAAKARIIQFQKGEIIYRQGDVTNGFYCILSGRVQAYCLDEHGKKYDVEFFRRSMYFGIISMLTGEHHSMTFEAMNDSRILRIDKEQFSAILKSIPQLGMAFSKSLSMRLQARSSRDKHHALNKIISIYSPVRQTGNSTYAFHLAYQIAEQAEANVILIRIASALPTEKEKYDGTQATPQWKDSGRHLDDIVGNDELIRSLIVTNEKGIDLLHVSFYPDDERLVSQISEFVTTLAIDYDYVVVDLPNDKDDVVMKTLTQSDEVHLLVHDSVDELKMISTVLNDLEEMLREKFNPQYLRVLLKTQKDVALMSFEKIREVLDYDIYARLSYVTDDQLSEAQDFGGTWVRFPKLDSEFGKEISKIAREVSGVRIGLVLGGGAALGVAHIGVIKVLERENIDVDIIAGSSMGALVASLWATEYDADCLVDIAQQFRGQRSMLKLFDPVIPVSGMLGGRLIKRWLHRFLGDKQFFDTRLPIKIVAYDLNNRQELVYDSGRLIDAVRKSISIPGIFEPVIEKDRVIIDGGVMNPVPANVLRNIGVHKIIAVNVLQSPEEVIKGYEDKQVVLEKQKKISFLKSPVKFLKCRLIKQKNKQPHPTISDIMVQTLLASEYEMARHAAQDVDVMIHPDLVGIQWYELYRVDDLIRRGEEAAERALPAIRELMKKK